MQNTLSHHLDRIALAIPEQRRELGLSRSDVALLAGVHGTKVGRLEDGRQIPPWELVRLAAALLVIEMHTAPWGMSAPDVIEEAAERIGRLAVPEILVRDAGERATAEIGGFLAAAMVLDAALDYTSAFAPEDVVSAFVDRLRNNVARYEEVAA